MLKFLHPSLGPIEITFRRGSSRISARWYNGIVRFIFPEGIDRNEIPAYIERLVPGVLSKKERHDVSFHDGQVIEVPGFRFVFSRQAHQPMNVWGTIKGNTAYIELGSELDPDSITAKRSISKIMCNIARDMAPQLLLPRAREIAAAIGVSPVAWHIMSGFHTLGKCTARREIHLSYMCMFLSAELRDYIVCHELAHLEEMSHSARFHEICDRYCGGREKSLVKALNAFRWPLLRK